MRKRTEKYRGSRTHGRGKKGGRGAGLRGGKGNAGLHKHKHTYMVKYAPDHFGRHGFKRHASLKDDKVTVNVGVIQSDLSRFVEYGLAKKEGDVMVIDLTKSKYSKLLGGGNIKMPVTIRVHEVTAKAREKIEAAGGKVEAEEKSDE
ncbi:MAG: 50S ribosomal protein L15 [Candidatus Thermoplasmatota archaeon]|nr:50S ribosomal protein L15 [Euryarchaeota archaeon]MBU4031924.1 50S ribosomal protein L15 [Candidatus Thermoplasmatota archaeon]MBU4071513.1 50S ribosomal protein L15 [Candidatus Thermoplasmatota archaeon]MBU4144164.1 50S ribosomal protein L15 [Candidatus Thermoplasmatota archaeon]MBU4592798.1 50S ribosomal protein L15 [Candidatus Thermoplasmatota archaeon]